MATVVLVHGAGTGGWLWDDVAGRLRTQGHTVEEMLQRRGSHPLASYREVVPPSTASLAEVPRRFISCTDKPQGDPLLALAAGLRRDGWNVQDLPTGHFAMLTMPAGLVDRLLAP